MKCNRHGYRTVSILVVTEWMIVLGNARMLEGRACAMSFSPFLEQILAARRSYEDRWQALDWARDGLLVDRMFNEVEQTAAMPKVRLSMSIGQIRCVEMLHWERWGTLPEERQY